MVLRIKPIDVFTDDAFALNVKTELLLLFSWRRSGCRFFISL